MGQHLRTKDTLYGGSLTNVERFHAAKKCEYFCAQTIGHQFACDCSRNTSFRGVVRSPIQSKCKLIPSIDRYHKHNEGSGTDWLLFLLRNEKFLG